MSSTFLRFTSLRCAWLRRWIALAFLLSTAIATASPILSPQSVELLCSSGGAMKLLVKSADNEEADAAQMHCSLCVQLQAPPPEYCAPEFRSLLAHATLRTPASALAALTRPPLPARGPPAQS